MKILYIIRHGKAETDSFSGRDYDRNLELRGINDAHKCASFVKEKNAKPDFLLSSTANRAFQTAQIFSHHFQKKVNAEPDLYNASLKTILKHVNEIQDSINEAMIFGHNPGFSQIASYLSNEYMELPTAGCVAIRFDNGLSWSELSAGSGKLLWNIYP